MKEWESARCECGHPECEIMIRVSPEHKALSDQAGYCLIADDCSHIGESPDFLMLECAGDEYGLYLWHH